MPIEPDILIEIDTLTCAYGEHVVLEEINLRLAAGEMVGLLGPNGSGKSTFLLALSGVMKRADRPLLQTEDPEAVMQKLMDQRYPIYATADVTVESRDVQHTQMVNEVIKILAKWPGWERLNNAAS